MNFFTTEETTRWCRARGLTVTGDDRLRYDSDRVHCFSIGLDDVPSRIIALANYLAPTWEGVPFEGALLWFTQRGVWGDFSEKTGDAILRQMRLANGETDPLEKRPGHLFCRNELFEMYSYFVLPLLFGWDAFLIPEQKEYFLFVSHDGLVGVQCRTYDVYSEMFSLVRSWNPREGNYLFN